MVEEAKAFCQNKEHFSVSDSVVVFKGRCVVPKTLRCRTLECLHSGHQGVKSIEFRAKDCVWWPRIYADIQAVRDKYEECTRDALSQAAVPPEDPLVLDYPFQQVCADYMEILGWHYLIVVD